MAGSGTMTAATGVGTGLARSVIRDRIGRRTGKQTGDDFDSTADDGINEGFKEALDRYSWREMCAEKTVSIASAATSGTFTATGYDSILGARLRLTSSPQTTYPFFIKTLEWINRHFPDRDRSGTQSGKPKYGAICVNSVEINIPADDAYTIHLTVDQPLTFDSADTDQNPVPLIDNALVHYGAHWVFESLGMQEESTRSLQLYERALAIAMSKDMRRPAVKHKFMARPLSIDRANDRSDEDNIFSLSDLQTAYP
ncbi:MAG: hypothetical protein Unbinned400contig1000_23 [Prokaryotic dsDNA virus sp.]|nr:MAG: hypothetical protein Unbinned400contig1000_23 [Prokaryotic dsDNA virus sp.]|tara:strand:+ start:12759 stop:13523 length:765 start_codon:yes stop_codon:yes gene_type:complete